MASLYSPHSQALARAPNPILAALRYYVGQARTEYTMSNKKITSSIQKLIEGYPHRTTKEGQFGGKLALKELREFMASIPGTPCCVQISHALNMAGHLIPRHYPGERRKNKKGTLVGNSPIKIGGREYYYLLAVDEMETYLAWEYGPGELVSTDLQTGKRRSSTESRRYLAGRTGILVMRDSTPGVHTELWDGNSFVQKDMAADHLLGLPRVLFWDCGAPRWLHDYMQTQ